jgi:beta-phosphoglucomutase-like phosphatase (HAD superfamily)
MKIKAVFWDLDGTLIDSEQIHEEAAWFATRMLGYERTLDAIPAGLENAAVFELLTDRLAAESPELFSRWDAFAIEYALERISNRQQILNSVQLFNHFAEQGIKQTVVSNSGRLLVEHSLRQLGLHGECCGIFCRDDVEFGKPHPELYLNALKFHNLHPRECLAFEDSRSGIAAAKAAGLQVVGIGKDSAKHQPDFVLELEDEQWLSLLNARYLFTN